ncbi:unnamed protein product [Pleuronectes platessa]|uniref:Uncharacterized protein n=1 Tax=Pleuronectes platessa TaxID=8262 RepID=A0A9N7URQ6_PLEPL|nr:unnamed protein product [Pleuronectes platessa]
MAELVPANKRWSSHRGEKKDEIHVKMCLAVFKEKGELPRFVSHYIDELPSATACEKLLEVSGSLNERLVVLAEVPLSNEPAALGPSLVLVVKPGGPHPAVSQTPRRGMEWMATGESLGFVPAQWSERAPEETEHHSWSIMSSFSSFYVTAEWNDWKEMHDPHFCPPGSVVRQYFEPRRPRGATSSVGVSTEKSEETDSPNGNDTES